MTLVMTPIMLAASSKPGSGGSTSSGASTTSTEDLFESVVITGLKPSDLSEMVLDFSSFLLENFTLSTTSVFIFGVSVSLKEGIKFLTALERNLGGILSKLSTTTNCPCSS